MRITSLAFVVGLAILLTSCGGQAPDPMEDELKGLSASDTVKSFLDQSREKLAGILGENAVTASPYQVLKADDFDTKYAGRPVAWSGQISDASVEEGSVVLIIAYTEGKKIYRIFTKGGELGNAANRKGTGGGWVVFTGILEGRDGDTLRVRDLVLVARRLEGPEATTEEFWDLAKQAASELK